METEKNLIKLGFSKLKSFGVGGEFSIQLGEYTCLAILEDDINDTNIYITILFDGKFLEEKDLEGCENLEDLMSLYKNFKPISFTRTITVTMIHPGDLNEIKEITGEYLGDLDLCLYNSLDAECEVGVE